MECKHLTIMTGVLKIFNYSSFEFNPKIKFVVAHIPNEDILIITKSTILNLKLL